MSNLSAKSKIKAREYMKKTYDERRAAGLCTHCGKVKTTKTRCTGCLQPYKYRQANLVSLRILHGLCITCGEPNKGKFQSCFDCRMKASVKRKAKSQKKVNL